MSDSSSEYASISSLVTWPMPEVLIEDDSRFQRQMLAAFLLLKEYEVVFAGDVLQTFRMALNSRPHSSFFSHHHARRHEDGSAQALGLSGRTPIFRSIFLLFRRSK